MLPRRLVVALAAIARASDALSVDPFAWRDRDPFAPAGAAMAAASRLRSAAAVAPVGAPAPRPATSLRYYLDTADADEWAALLPLGIFRGVTTNPTLLERAGVACTVASLRAHAAAAFALGAREFMAQSWGGARDELVAVGLALAAIDDRVTVKASRWPSRPSRARARARSVGRG